MNDELIRYQSVEICYDNSVAVKNVSFSLDRGMVLAIVGESGSGKTTLVRAAMGLLPKTATVTVGDIIFDGKNIPDLPEHDLRKIRGARIGMIFQDAGASLCPVRTIGEQIYESLRAHVVTSKTEAKAKALELFQKLDFPDGERVYNSYPFELSGGMNQRAGIAIAMLSSPELLLADEPTSALDVSVQKQVLSEMRRLCELFGTAIMLVTHDISVARYMADRVLVLRRGEIVEYGTTEQVLTSPRSSYTKTLLSAVPILRRRA